MFSRIFRSLFVVMAFFAPFAAKAEIINAFDVTATISPDRNVVFEETITYDFGTLDRHGIFRFIPEKTLRDGVVYRYRYKVLDVTRDGKPEPYDTSRSDGNLEIKIGDADKEITGSHVYRIRYQTDRAVTFFGDHDELYWNVTGNEWNVRMEKASMTVRLPDGGTVTDSICYTGPRGATEQDCSASGSGKEVRIASNRVLLDGEGLTAAVSFSKGIVQTPTTWDKIWMIIKDNGILFFPLAALFIMSYRWWTKGRDPSLHTIIAQYEPPRGLRPAIMVAAMHEMYVPTSAITATIIDLAYRGYLHIRVDERKKVWGKPAFQYTFIKKKTEETAPLRPHETAILNGLFKGGDSQTLDDLKVQQFHVAAKTMNQEVDKEINAMKLFDASPGAVRGAHISVAIVLAGVLGIFFMDEPLGVLSLIAMALIIIVIGWSMPRRNTEGRKLLEEILGFKLFLSVTEKDRMAFHNAPARKPEQFQEFLPYAIIFGVEKEWAKQFEDLHLEPPKWVEGTASSHFAITGIAHSLSSMSAAASTSAYSVPSSGGSGFSGGSSGGGGGGGGGGSW